MGTRPKGPGNFGFRISDFGISACSPLDDSVGWEANPKFEIRNSKSDSSRTTSAPTSGLMPASLAAFQNRGAPETVLRSISATAGSPSSTARSTRSSGCDAPSRKENADAQCNSAYFTGGSRWIERKKNHQDTKTPRESTKKNAETQRRRSAELSARPKKNAKTQSRKDAKGRTLSVKCGPAY